MKTYKNLYPQVWDFANLYAAWRRARCGNRDRAAVASFEFDLERKKRASSGAAMPLGVLARSTEDACACPVW